MSASEPYVSLEFTPNPNTLKYVVEKMLLEKGAANFVSADSAAESPLALRIFKTPGVSAVMIGRNFVTITKADNVEWDQIHTPTEATIKEFLVSDEVAITKTATLETVSSTGNNADIENRIKEVLDNEIRPAVAQDGGDITFDRYENGVVYLLMQGSCAGCPSSTITLKMGIETRLKELIPEIIEVQSI